MNDKNNERQKELRTLANDLDGALRKAGQRIANSSVSIRELAPDFCEYEVQNVRRSPLYTQRKIWSWCGIASAVVVVVFSVWFLLDSNSEKSSRSTDPLTVSKLDAEEVGASLKPEFAQRVFSFLASDHMIDLNLNEPTLDADSESQMPDSLVSLTKPRRISLDSLSRSLTALDDISMPEIRFRLVIGDQ